MQLIIEMRRKGITQNMLAELLGISINSMSQKMTGKRQFKAKEMILIRDTYFPDKTLDQLFLS